MKDFLRVSEAANLLRVTPQTIRKYGREGKLSIYKTPGGQTIYKTEEIMSIINSLQEPDGKSHAIEPQTIIFYIRSSDGDKEKMLEQEKQLTSKYGTPHRIYRDKASGLNEKRQGLKKLINDVKNKKVKNATIYFTQKDRLTRFGYTYLEELFAAYDTKVEAAFDKEDKSLHEELMQDFMSLIASFSGKYYRLRGYEQKKKLLREAEEELEHREKESTTRRVEDEQQ